MTARDRDEADRVSTPLEWLFDLCFVVAAAQASERLHHYVSAGRLEYAVTGYLVVFFGIWWAWMNFSWFASAFDTDDVPYRITTFVQMVGVLIYAAGIPRAFDARDFAVAAVGYAVMRGALVLNWLRAAAAEPDLRGTALRFAGGIAGCEAAWVGMLLLPHSVRIWGWVVLIPAELAVPLWAQRKRPAPWHPRHITERYGLFTILVLGESIFASTVAIQDALDHRSEAGELDEVTAGGLLTVFALWWLYFARPAYRFLVTRRTGLGWGYGHYAIFAATAAIGPGLATVVDETTGYTELSTAMAGATVTVPVAAFLVSVWWIHLRPFGLGRSGLLEPAAAIAVLATTWTAQPALTTGLIVVALVVTLLLTTWRNGEDGVGVASGDASGGASDGATH